MSYKLLIINLSYLNKLIWKYGCKVLETRRKLNFFERILWHFKICKSSFYEYKNWEKQCDANYDIIILMDSTQDILDQTRKIEREAPLNTRLILYLLNPADYIGSQYKQVSQRWEIWSFSKKDSREYGFKYGNTFYFRELVPQKTIPSIQYDSVFIGLDKRRKQSLKEIRYMYRSAGIIPFFYIVDNVKRLYNKQYKKRISYEDVVKLVMDSKSITEVLQQNQDGMTLRTMESIFLKRKIITTNPSIKTQRIYHPNNVFVLGEDDIKHLYDFVNTPYTEIDEKEVNKYLFSSWLQRIINNEEFE